MEYAAEQRNPTRRAVGFVIVALLHVLLIYALINGLGEDMVELVKSPIETKIIKQVQPPPPQHHAIQAVTHVKPPAPSPVPYQGKPVVKAPPDTSVSARPVAGFSPDYPSDYASEGRPGHVLVACDVDATGATHGCTIESEQGGAAFGRSVLAAAQEARFRPATHNGVPVPGGRRAWDVTFTPQTDQ